MHCRASESANQLGQAAAFLHFAAYSVQIGCEEGGLAAFLRNAGLPNVSALLDAPWTATALYKVRRTVAATLRNDDDDDDDDDGDGVETEPCLLAEFRAKLTALGSNPESHDAYLQA